MLVLSRKKNESIVINNDITVTVVEIRGDKVIYAYADPTICVCLYVGNPTNYSAYRARVFDKHIADEQVTVANDMYYMSNWDWSPWAVGYPPGWPRVDSIYNY